jgi:hypothetical protein
MCKKLMFLISLVMVLGLATVASADTYNYTGDYPWSYLYISPWNWDPVPAYGGPGIGDQARISTGGPIVLDTDIAVEEIRGPAYDSDVDQIMYLVKDCNLIVTRDWRSKDGGDGVSIINMSDSAKVNITGWDDNKSFRAFNGSTILTMVDDTEFRTEGDLRFADDDSDYFELNMSDNAYMHIKEDDDGFRSDDGGHLINVSGDAVIDTKKFRLRQKDAYGEINISGNGVINVYDDNAELVGGEADGAINVTENAQFLIDGGLRLGEDNDFEGLATLWMTGLLIDCDKLRIPAHDESTGLVEVYLYGGVINVRDELEHETDNWIVYICGDGVMVVNGDIVDDVYEEALEGHWVACPQEDCWGDISPRGNLMAQYDTLEYPGKTKIWVQDVNGQVWSPRPEDGAVDVPPIAELCWCAGDIECPLDGYHIFLSDDRQEVEDGNLHAWQGVQTGTCFTTEPLCLGKTYYWRVETVGDCCYYPGPVWQFTVVDSECIEDMEAYDDAGNPIWETWLDGCGDANGVGGNGTGSCVYTDTEIVNSGDKSMRYYYDCSGEDMAGDERDCNYALATRALNVDLSSSCAEAIELWFYGDPGNDATALEAMFMQVKDSSNNSAVATYGNTAPEALADMQVAEWQPWDIALTTFGGVDTTDVVEISLGFGDVTNCHREKGGYGVMRLDDICIFACRCVTKYTPDIVDLNGDCMTNWLDMKLVADNWLADERCNQ